MSAAEGLLTPELSSFREQVTIERVDDDQGDTRGEEHVDQIPREALQHLAAVRVAADSEQLHERAATKPTVRSLRVADRARDEILEQRDLEVVEVARRRAVDGAAPREHRGVRRLRLA